MILFPTVLSPQYYLQETHAINDFFGIFFSLQPSNFFFFLKLFKLNFIFHGIFFFKRMLLLKRFFEENNEIHQDKIKSYAAFCKPKFKAVVTESVLSDIWVQVFGMRKKLIKEKQEMLLA